LELLVDFANTGRPVNHCAGPNYAPKQFATTDRTIAKAEFRAAQDRLFDRGALKVEHDKASRVKRVVAVEPRLMMRRLQEAVNNGHLNASPSSTL
jgi:hypothetical protein